MTGTARRRRNDDLRPFMSVRLFAQLGAAWFIVERFYLRGPHRPVIRFRLALSEG